MKRYLEIIDHQLKQAGIAAPADAPAHRSLLVELSKIGDSRVDLARDRRAILKLLAGQQASGALLRIDPSGSPELAWYDELVLLHTLTTFGVCENHAPALTAARKAASYHLNETQPDHATNRPWAIHAFLLDPATFPLADLMLNAASIQLAQNNDRVTLLLLADALYCGNVYCAAQSA